MKPCKFGPIKPQTGHGGSVPSVIGNLTSYFSIRSNNETALKMAVAIYGPVSVSICATCPTFLNDGYPSSESYFILNENGLLTFLIHSTGVGFTKTVIQLATAQLITV